MGAARVFVGSASLPLFNDVDEQAHFDVIHKYSRGYWPLLPREHWDRETAEVQVLYGSYEFMNRPEKYPGGVYPPPVWTWAPSPERDDYVERSAIRNIRRVNHEAHSPPVYYLAGAAWYKLGRLFGLNGPGAVYWVRFLNVALCVALIAAASAFCRAYFSPFVALAVPALVAFFPSAVFFGITSDALSPLLVLLALWFLLRWHQRTSPSPWLSLLVGLTAAAAFLVKLSNAVILAACGVVVLWRWHQDRRGGTLRANWPRGALVLLAMSLPIAGWMLQNELFLGDLAGTGAKVRDLGWRLKPIAALLDHPLFTFDGQRVFWSTLLSSFYTGDMNWQGLPAMGSVPSRIFFLTSFAFLPVALGLAWFRRRRSAEPRFLAAGALCALLLAGSILVLIVQSLLWDFGAGVYPSREYPYMSSGRLISGAIVPFLALYAWSVETIFHRRNLVRIAVLALSVAMMLWPQGALLAKAVQSRHNWFHLFVPGSESEAHTGLGLIALKRGRIDEATARFSRASALDPANLAALANLGMTLADRGQNELAAQVFTQALQVQPVSAELHNSRGTVLAMQGKWAAAAEDYRDAVRLSPQTSHYRFPLAHALSKVGRSADAERVYAEALRLAPQWPERIARIAKQFSTHPDPEERRRLAARAVHLAEQASAALGGGRIELLEILAGAYGEAGRFEEAVATADRGIRVAENTGEPDVAAQWRERRDEYRKQTGSR